MRHKEFCRCLRLPPCLRNRVAELGKDVEDFEPFLRRPDDFCEYPFEERALFFLWMIPRNPGDPHRMLDSVLETMPRFEDTYIYYPYRYVRSAICRAE